MVIEISLTDTDRLWWNWNRWRKRLSEQV